MTYRIEDRATGALRDGLSGVRATLTLDGSALFAGPGGNGLLLDGTGTQRALVEFIGGLVTLQLADPVSEIVNPGAEDTERNGVVIQGDRIFKNFEFDDGGFTHRGANNTWQHGVPTWLPVPVYSGLKIWSSNLDDRYRRPGEVSLTSPLFRMGKTTS